MLRVGAWARHYVLVLQSTQEAQMSQGTAYLVILLKRNEAANAENVSMFSCGCGGTVVATCLEWQCGSGMCHGPEMV